MTEQEIQALARATYGTEATPQDLAFASAVAAAERDAIYEITKRPIDWLGSQAARVVNEIQFCIRARGEVK